MHSAVKSAQGGLLLLLLLLRPLRCGRCRQCLSGLMFTRNEGVHRIKRKNINKVHESGPCILPVTSCVSSWLLLLTMLTDMFLDDCRNSGRPCRERDGPGQWFCYSYVWTLSTRTRWQALKLNYRERAVLLSDGLTSRFKVIKRDRY